jgi:hypothetical protein
MREALVVSGTAGVQRPKASRAPFQSPTNAFPLTTLGDLVTGSPMSYDQSRAPERRR